MATGRTNWRVVYLTSLSMDVRGPASGLSPLRPTRVAGAEWVNFAPHLTLIAPGIAMPCRLTMPARAERLII